MSISDIFKSFTDNVSTKVDAIKEKAANPTANTVVTPPVVVPVANTPVVAAPVPVANTVTVPPVANVVPIVIPPKPVANAVPEAPLVPATVTPEDTKAIADTIGHVIKKVAHPEPATEIKIEYDRPDDVVIDLNDLLHSLHLDFLEFHKEVKDHVEKNKETISVKDLVDPTKSGS